MGILQSIFGESEAKDEKQLAKHAKNGDWGLYTNVRLDMTLRLVREKKDRPALECYLEIFYLDANGPCNTGGNTDRKPFDRATAFQAPETIRQIEKLSESLQISKNDLEKSFFKVAERVQKKLKLPTSPKQAWVDLSNALNKKKK